MSTTQERMAAGAALLDERGPEDWRERVAAFGWPLDMYTDCVLDRVHGGYFAGKAALGLSGRDVVDFGFCPFGRDAHKLADAWEAEVRKGQS